MSLLYQIDRTKIPRNRIELHLHLDGSLKPETIWELAKAKNISLPAKDASDLKQLLLSTMPANLKTFLDKFAIFFPVLVDDLEVCKRMAYELCKSQSEEGVLYFETRYDPHIILSGSKPLSVQEVVQAVNQGLEKGEMDFGVKSRSILCCLLNRDDWAVDTLKLCEEFRGKGVVGIDIAKNEEVHPLYTTTEISVYERARALGIHRTAHAGESGTWESVRDAMQKLDCTRVGHGYRVFWDTTGNTYKEALDRKLHFEVCPYSSVLTGGADLKVKHPVVRFAEDGANFSISKDDSLITGTTLDDEYKLLRTFGLNEAHIIQANFNAAASCFLEGAEKQDLINQLKSNLRVPV